jgi:hypothetical protein
MRGVGESLQAPLMMSASWYKRLTICSKDPMAQKQIHEGFKASEGGTNTYRLARPEELIYLTSSLAD